MFEKAKTLAVMLLSLSVIIGCGVARAAAQQADSPKAVVIKDSPADPVVTAYRLDFSINEMQDGKKSNARQYLMDLNSAEGGSADLKIGTRIPMEVKEGEIQYLDLGTSISARIQKHKDEPVGLWVRADISNLANPDAGNTSRPILRQFRIEGSTTWALAVVGKPMVMGSVDDPDSKRTFQLEVTVTKLR